MRSASVDNRSRSMWLLAGLGVLVWAAFSVLVSGSAAHADENASRPPHATSQQSDHRTASKHARAPHAQAQRAKPALIHDQRAQPASRPVRSTVADTARPVTGPRPDTTRPDTSRPATTVRGEVASSRPGPARESVPSLRPTGTPRAATPSSLAEMRSLQARVKNAIAQDRSHGKNRHADRAPGHHFGDDTQRTHPRHGIHSPGVAHAARTADAFRTAHAAPAHRPARASHPAPATVTTRAVAAPAPATATATVTATVLSEQQPAGHAPTRSPFDPRGVTMQHPPATAPSISSSAAGASASAGDLPGALQADDVLGPLLAAVHAHDDVMPSGPAGTTDHSPD